MESTKIAIRAAQNVRTWGLFAAFQYARRRGVPVRLVTIARQLEAVKGF